MMAFKGSLETEPTEKNGVVVRKCCRKIKQIREVGKLLVMKMIWWLWLCVEWKRKEWKIFETWSEIGHDIRVIISMIIEIKKNILENND